MGEDGFICFVIIRCLFFHKDSVPESDEFIFGWLQDW